MFISAIAGTFFLLFALQTAEAAFTPSADPCPADFQRTDSGWNRYRVESIVMDGKVLPGFQKIVYRYVVPSPRTGRLEYIPGCAAAFLLVIEDGIGRFVAKVMTRRWIDTYYLLDSRSGEWREGKRIEIHRLTRGLGAPLYLILLYGPESIIVEVRIRELLP